MDPGHRRLRDQRAPVRTRLRRRRRRPVAELGDDLPVAWLHRSERYGEKLATPDTSVGDLIGDVDPIKVAEGRTLGDPETMHYGLVPRTNRGIFAVNELPDLAERIQVALLNVLEERDIQVRGYPLRLPLDLLLVASANPEDYTNRGRIITPLKDRFGAEIRTHYPLDARRRDRPGPPGGRTSVGRACREHLLEVVARFTRAVRESPRWTSAPASPPGSPIAAAETVAASALRRAALTGEARAPWPGSATCRRRARTLRGKVEFEIGEEGRETRGARAPAARGRRRDVPGPARPGWTCPGFTDAVRRGRDGRDRRAGAGRRAARARSAPCRAWPRCSTGSAYGDGAEPRARRPPRVEFALEGLHLTRRLAKDDARHGRDASTASREADARPCRLPVRGVARRARPARAAVRRARGAVDEIGDDVLAGGSLREALRDLLRRGAATAARAGRPAPPGSRELRREAPRPRPTWTAPSTRSGAARPGPRRRARELSADATTTPGSPRRSWTTCPDDTAGRCGSWPTTSGARDEARAGVRADPRPAAREVLDSAVPRA